MAGNWNSGRRPNPNKLKMLRGNPGRQRLKPNELQIAAAPADFDAVPQELAADARAVAEWNRIVPLLRVTGVISTAERSVLIAVCREWSRYVMANEQLEAQGLILATGRNPYLRISNDALRACQKLWPELGLTPNSRTRLSSLPGSQATTNQSKWANEL